MAGGASESAKASCLTVAHLCSAGPSADVVDAQPGGFVPGVFEAAEVGEVHGGRPRLEADRFECRSDGGRGRPVVELERERVARNDLLGFGDERLDVVGAHTGADGAAPSSRRSRSVEPAVPPLHQVVPHLRRWLPVPASDLGSDRVVAGVSVHRCQFRRGPLRSRV